MRFAGMEVTLKTELDIEALAKEYADAFLDATRTQQMYLSMNGLHRYIVRRMSATASFLEMDAVEAAAKKIIWPEVYGEPTRSAT